MKLHIKRNIEWKKFPPHAKKDQLKENKTKYNYIF